MALILLAAAHAVMAQKFEVAQVKTMKNDVSAFISPVRDLNGQACALIRVEAPADFAFSTPLGIVKRQDEVGEIMLYVPHGTKMLTIKHPQWGILRNFQFEQPLESHLCYVMKINCPQQPAEEIHDTLVITETRIDTVTVERRRTPVPLALHVMLTTSIYKTGASWGFMLACMKRHGAFLHASTDFRSTGDIRIEVNRNGMPTDGSGIMPYYTGNARHCNYMVIAGLTHRITRNINILEGGGYGKTATSWQLAEEEGGGYALNQGLTHKGWAAEAGVMWHDARWTVAASASTLKFKQWQMNIGIGITLGKK